MKTVCCLLWVLCAGLTMFAQNTHKNELGLLLGAEIIPDRTAVSGNVIDLSRSIVFSANYARHLTGEKTSLYLEFPFAAAPSHKITSTQTGIITDLATLYVTPSLRLQFANQGAVVPWISGGFGYGQYEGSQRLADGSANPDERQHVGTAQFGAGVDIRTTLRVLFPIGLRAEVRDYYTVNPPSFAVPVRGTGQHNVVVAGGIVLGF